MAPGRRIGSPALTLVELLVVASVIIVLGGLLLPAVDRSIAAARTAVCQQRLRQWGQAFAMYASANDGFYPHIDGLDRDSSPADKCGWVDALPPLFHAKRWRDHPRYGFPGSSSIFQCPSACLASDKDYKYDPRRDGYFSYAMNSCLELDRDCWRAPGDGGVPMPSFLRTDEVLEPTRVIMLFDQALVPKLGYDGKLMNRSAGKYCGSYPKAFSAQHRRSGSRLGGSLLYCDGHVQWVASVWKPEWPVDLEVPPRDDPDWFPYPP